MPLTRPDLDAIADALATRDRMASAVGYADAPLVDHLRALLAWVAEVERERDEARRMLGECVVLSGADTDGAGWEHNWSRAVDEVRQLRQDYDDDDDFEKARAALAEAEAGAAFIHELLTSCGIARGTLGERVRRLAVSHARLAARLDRKRREVSRG